MLLWLVFLTLNSKEDNIDNPPVPNADAQPSKKRETKALEPNQTLYIRNLNEKIKKEGMCYLTSWVLNLIYGLFYMFWV